MLSSPWVSPAKWSPVAPGPTPNLRGATSLRVQTAVRSLQPSKNVVSRVVANEAIVVPIRKGAADMDSIFTFNESGSMLWALLEKGGNAEDLSARLQLEYGISAEQATADSQGFIAELNEAGLIELQ
jgi:Coenzyme PQQ synthesis protein D (PqqD)